MKNKHRDKGVFAAANAMEIGKLPKRKDAVEYIWYLLGLYAFTSDMLQKREQELESLGWKRPEWPSVSTGATWTYADTQSRYVGKLSQIAVSTGDTWTYVDTPLSDKA